jgi:hypothetical protein
VKTLRFVAVTHHALRIKPVKEVPLLMRSLSFIAIVASFLSLWGCGGRKPIAVVGGRVISQSEKKRINNEYKR